jgi:predicted CXXCH cytochrome family protein
VLLKGRIAIPLIAFITAVLTLLVLTWIVLAQADPHGDYSDVTDACAACHRTHTGAGSYVLNSAAQDNAFCFTCHDGTGAPALPIISTHANTDFAARVEADFELECIQCHSPHGSANLYSVKEYVVVQDGATPVTSGPVVFTVITGTNSFDDGTSAEASRICVTCHVNSDDPGYPMTDHTGGANHHGGSDYSGQDCTTCHAHSVDGDRYTLDGFMADCTSCHGQPPNGTSAPNRDGSHSTHFTPTAFGPQINPGICDDCHTFSAATHNDGQVTFADGQLLSTTTACDDCHSPGGDYDGVNDAAIGAKNNWDGGVYTGSNLATGQEKWCAGCHDDAPSTVRGTSAPNVIGDENAVTNYGLGYGFYKTGHGLPAVQTYPASGGTVRGASVSCGYCHDSSLQHTDGVTRTYNYTATTGAADDYQHGYRLKSIDGQLPLIIPRVGTCADSGVNATEFRLCFSCHASGPFREAGNYATYFRHTGTPDFNAHNYHLGIMFDCGYGPVFSSDWSYAAWDSRASCVTCHNVHGSEQLAMTRDGKLINGEPGLELLYYDPSVSFDCANYPDKRDVSLPESTGTIWAQNASGLCSTCHGSCGLDSVYYRSTPPQITHVQGQIGSDVLIAEFSEGVYSDPGASGSLTPGDFTLTDLDDGRAIIGLVHNAGDDHATLTLDTALDASDDVDVDTLAAATAASIYDAASTPMDTTPVTLTGPDAVPQTLVLHPSGLDATTACNPVGGAWADILDSNDEATTYADCYSYQATGPGGGFFPAQFQVNMDDASGLGGTTINQLVVRAIVDVTEVSGGGGPSGPLAYMQICYDTGGASQECSVVYDLDGAEGWVQIWVGDTVDPDGNPLDLDDLNNLHVQVHLEANNCCGDATARAYVTEVYAEVDYSLVTDLAPPVLSNQNPADGASGVNVGSDLTFTLADTDSGVDWATFEIELVGSKGYSKLYTDADYFVVSKTGSFKNYQVTVNPDVDLGGEETITVTVRVDDYAGNSLAHPAWSFTTAPAPILQTIVLHPSGVADDGGYTVTGGTWADALDTNDGDTSHVYFCCSGPGQIFYVDMDDPALSNVVINDLTVHVYARYVDGNSPNPPVITGDLDIGYKTGTDTIWKGSTTTDASGDYNLISSATYHLDSDSGPLDLADVNNLQIAVKRNAPGSAKLRVTEVYVEVVYYP